MSPNQFAEGGILQQLDADIVFPQGIGLTCTAGTGHILDWFVVSRRLSPSIKSIKQDMEAPWFPHIGMLLTLAGNPTEVYVTKQIKPAGFYEAYQDKKQKTLGTVPTHRQHFRQGASFRQHLQPYGRLRTPLCKQAAVSGECRNLERDSEQPKGTPCTIWTSLIATLCLWSRPSVSSQGMFCLRAKPVALASI